MKSNKKEHYTFIAKYIANHFINFKHYNNIELIKHFIIKNSTNNNIYFKYKRDVFHIKIVNKAYPNIHLKMLQNYNSLMMQYENSRIHQYILYIGDDKCSLKSSVNRDELIYVYDVIDVNDFNRNDFIKCYDPTKVILSIFFKCNEVFINKIINRLYELSIDEKEFKYYLKELKLLAKYKNLDGYIKSWENTLQNNIYKNVIFNSWRTREQIL